jgi:hypothetical protein
MNRVYNLPNKTLYRNPSIEMLENVLKLPIITNKDNKRKEIQFQYEDNDFILHYFENKKRIRLNYSEKKISLNSTKQINCAGI